MDKPPPVPPSGELDRLRLAAVVESSDDAIVSKDLDGTIRTWNRAAERIFGYTAAEMVGNSVFRLIPPELHEEEHTLLARIRAVAVGGGPGRRLVGAVGAALDQLQLADVARQRRLRHVEPRRTQLPPQLLLAAHRLVLHGGENRRLAARFHGNYLTLDP